MTRLGKGGIAAAAALSLTLAGCAQTTHRDNFTIGGMIAGAAAGAAVAGGVRDKNAGIAIIAGAVIGGLAGLLIGTRLDEAEQQKAEAAAANSAAQGERIYWSSPKRPGEVSGYAEPLPQEPEKPSSSAKTAAVPEQAESAAPTATQATAVNSTTTTPTKAANDPSTGASTPRNCRRVREVAVLRGSESVIESTYCNTGSGWVRAS